MTAVNNRSRWNQTVLGSDYTDEERVFMLAMEKYIRENRRPFPTWSEVLAVAHDLGYRLTSEGKP